MKKVSFLIAALGFTLFGNAQQSEQENSLLWKIEGNGLSKPSYLFGTIHMLCKTDFEIKEKVNNAFNCTTNLVMELDMDDPNELQAMQKMMASETTLSSLLTEEEKQSVNAMLTSSLGITLKQADNMSPVGLLSMSIVSAYSCPPNEMKMYEFEFLAKATAQNKKIGGLETFAEQIASFGKAYDIKEIIKQIGLRTEYGKLLAAMIQSYKEENLAEIYKGVCDKRFMDESAKKSVMSGRNQKWANKIPSIMKQESTFFAVGAGHLYGTDGVIALLKQKGYNVTPIK